MVIAGLSFSFHFLYVPAMDSYIFISWYFPVPTFLYLFLFIFEKLEGKEQNSINKEANFWKYKNKSLVNPKVEKEKLFLRYILPTATVKKRKEKEKAVGNLSNKSIIINPRPIKR